MTTFTYFKNIDGIYLKNLDNEAIVFVDGDEFDKNLKQIGKVHLLRQKYNAYRGSRNLKARSIHVDELLYVLQK